MMTLSKYFLMALINYENEGVRIAKISIPLVTPEDEDYEELKKEWHGFGPPQRHLRWEKDGKNLREAFDNILNIVDGIDYMTWEKLDDVDESTKLSALEHALGLISRLTQEDLEGAFSYGKVYDSRVINALEYFQEYIERKDTDESLLNRIYDVREKCHTYLNKRFDYVLSTIPVMPPKDDNRDLFEYAVKIGIETEYGMDMILFSRKEKWEETKNNPWI